MKKQKTKPSWDADAYRATFYFVALRQVLRELERLEWMIRGVLKSGEKRKRS